MKKQLKKPQGFFLNKLLKHWDILILTVLIITYSIILASLAILRHDAFASRFDLANMDQTLWYTLHGHFFSLRSPDQFVSRFAIHADLILVLLAPLYLVWNDVRILLASGSVFSALGAIPVYLLSFKLLKNKIVSLVIVAAYLLNPGMQWTDIYEFHGVSMSVPFMLAAFYFAYSKRWRWYGLFILLALLTKEEISLNVAMLGLFVALVFKKWWIGFSTFFVGVIWFLTMVYIVIPHFSPTGQNWVMEGLGNAGMNPLQDVVNQIKSKDFLTLFFFNKTSLDYYILLLKPFAFLPLLGLPWLLLSAPEVAINIIRGSTTINFHYDSGVTPSLVLATIFGFYYVKLLLNKWDLTKRVSEVVLSMMAVFLLVVAVRVNYHYSPLPTTPSCWCSIYDVKDEDRAFERALQSIPKDAMITASLEVRPHISHRDLAFTVPSATESAQYIALITQNRIPGNFNPKEYENWLIPILLSSKDYRTTFRSEHFYLFEKVNAN